MRYHAHSENPEQDLKNFFAIGLTGFVLLELISAAVLIMLNSKAIWQLFHGSEISSQASFRYIINQRFVPVGQALNSPVFARFGLLLFWALIGCLTYMIIWLVQYALTSAREDYVEGHYVHPRSYSSQTYWRTIFAHRIFLLSTIIVFVGYLSLMARVGLPVLSKLFYVGLYDLPSISALLGIILSILITGLGLYAGYLLWKVLRGTWGLVQIPE